MPFPNEYDSTIDVHNNDMNNAKIIIHFDQGQWSRNKPSDEEAIGKSFWPFTKLNIFAIHFACFIGVL